MCTPGRGYPRRQKDAVGAIAEAADQIDESIDLPIEVFGQSGLKVNHIIEAAHNGARERPHDQRIVRLSPELERRIQQRLQNLTIGRRRDHCIQRGTMLVQDSDEIIDIEVRDNANSQGHGRSYSPLLEPRIQSHRKARFILRDATVLSETLCRVALMWTSRVVPV